MIPFSKSQGIRDSDALLIYQIAGTSYMICKISLVQCSEYFILVLQTDEVENINV